MTAPPPRREEPFRCDDCAVNNPAWFAPGRLWRMVVPEMTPTLCPTCFIRRAEERGLNVYWKVDDDGIAVAETLAARDAELTSALTEVATLKGELAEARREIERLREALVEISECDADWCGEYRKLAREALGRDHAGGEQ